MRLIGFLIMILTVPLGLFAQERLTTTIDWVELDEKDYPEDDTDTVALVTKLNEMKAGGSLKNWERYRLDSIVGEESMVQLGKTVPIVTGRTIRRPPEGANPFPVNQPASYSMTNIGMVIKARFIPNEEGDLILGLTLEKSDLQDKAAAEGELAPQGQSTRLIKTTICPEIGVPSVVSSVSVNGSRIVVLATVKKGKAAPSNAISQLKVFHLQFAQAEQAAVVVKELYEQESMRIIADERTNSLIVSGGNEHLEEVETLVKLLDVK